MRKLVLLVIVALVASPAMAGFTATNAGPLASNGPLETPIPPLPTYNGYFTYDYAGPEFAVGDVIFNGTLSEPVPPIGSYQDEARINITDPVGVTAGWNPGSGGAGWGSVTFTDMTVTGGGGFWSGTAGTWVFSFSESYDDGGPDAIDAWWTDLSFEIQGDPIPDPNPVVYEFNMDTDPGWTMDAGEWQFGAPGGLGGEHGNPDPTAASTGTNVYGYDLTGLGANPGDYEASMTGTEYLTTTALDFTGYTEVQLEFDRYLNVESPSYDHANIEVSNDGVNWTEVWANGGTVTDAAWTTELYDISAVADGESMVYVRWGMGPTDSSWFFSGWNIDDVVFRAVPEPASLALLMLGGLAVLRRR